MSEHAREHGARYSRRAFNAGHLRTAERGAT